LRPHSFSDPDAVVDANAAAMSAAAAAAAAAAAKQQEKERKKIERQMKLKEVLALHISHATPCNNSVITPHVFPRRFVPVFTFSSLHYNVTTLL
jgi:hypothetical protein